MSKLNNFNTLLQYFKRLNLFYTFYFVFENLECSKTEYKIITNLLYKKKINVIKPKNSQNSIAP